MALDRLSIDCYIAHTGRCPTRLMQEEALPVRKFFLSSILTVALFALTAITVLADSTGPGI